MNDQEYQPPIHPAAEPMDEEEARAVLAAVLRTAVDDCRAILAKDYVPSELLSAAAISAVRFLTIGWGAGLAETLCGTEGRKNALRLARRTAFALGMTIDEIAAIPEQAIAQAVSYDTRHLRALPKTKNRLRQGALRLGLTDEPVRTAVRTPMCPPQAHRSVNRTPPVEREVLQARLRFEHAA